MWTLWRGKAGWGQTEPEPEPVVVVVSALSRFLSNLLGGVWMMMMILSDSMGPSLRSLFMAATRVLLLSGMFLGCFSASNQPIPNGLSRTVAFPLQGNVYPQGFYSVGLRIGNPPQPYLLDIDTGSDLTWLQCDAPCVSCIKAPHPLYKVKKVVPCKDPMCTALHWPSPPPCDVTATQCDYEVKYHDHGSSLGILVTDNFNFLLTNGTPVAPRLALGCGYDQEFPGPNAPPFVDGVLGLGNGKSSIVTQLRDQGLIPSVVGHCLSGQGGGFLSLGDGFSATPGMVWAPMSRNSGSENKYALGPADLLYNGQSSGVKGLSLVFDSGSSYTYFNAQAYTVTLSLLRKSLNGKLRETADETLPVCWTGGRPFRSVPEVKTYFKPLALSFAAPKNAQLLLPPESYLIISKHGNACLGVLNGSEVGLGDKNLIGDISFLDKMVIYDNERRQIGWVAKDCNKLPKDGRNNYNKGFSPSDLRMAVEQISAAYDESQEEL